LTRAVYDLFDLVSLLFALLFQPYVQELLWIVPFIKGSRRIEPLITLESYKLCVKQTGQNNTYLCLAHPRFSLKENRFFKPVG